MRVESDPLQTYAALDRCNSLSRPGGNVTGVTLEASDVVGKRLGVLDELVPGKRTVAVLMNPDTPFSVLALRELKAAAVEAAQPLHVFEARSADQVLVGVDTAAKTGAAGLLTLEDALLASTRRQIAERAIFDPAADRLWKQSLPRGGRIDLVRRRSTRYVPSRRRLRGHDSQR